MSECLGDIFVGNDCADPKSDCRRRLEADTVTIFLSGRFLDEPESNDFVAIPEDCKKIEEILNIKQAAV